MISAIGAGDAAASSSKKIMGKMIWFEQIWLDLGEILAKFWQKWLDLGKSKYCILKNIRSPTAELMMSTKRRWEVSFWTFFQISRQQSELEKSKPPKIFVDAGVSF